MKYNCIVVLGPTASGKTKLACKLAYQLNGEIISADSRQVYRHLNIGSGKDLDEYQVNEKIIPYHLIDICDPGEQFFLHEFIEALEKAFLSIRSRNRLPIICGGTGLYLDALRKDFSLTHYGENLALRKELKILNKEQLLERLNTYPKNLISQVDTSSVKRILRGIEIAEQRLLGGKTVQKNNLTYQGLYIGIKTDIEERRKKIEDRLIKRLNSGLIDEVKALLNAGISHQRLEYLGLEYKFVSLYLQGKITQEELVLQLKTAIFQFAKRQMTWFRKMEKEGVKINWVSVNYDLRELLASIKEHYFY